MLSQTILRFVKANRSSEESITKSLLNHKFPINKCDSPFLKESISDILSGVRSAVSDYVANVTRYDYPIFDRTGSRHTPTIEGISEGVCEVNMKDESTPSSILSVSETLVDDPFDVVRSKMTALLNTRYSVLAKDRDFDEMVIFTVNSFFQTLEGVEVADMCREILDKLNHRTLVEDLDFIFVDHYDESKVYSFIDSFNSCMLDVSFLERGLENPGNFARYREMWLFDPSDYKAYDESDFILEYSEVYFSDVLYYNYVGSRMNLRHFYNYFSRSPEMTRFKRQGLPNHQKESLVELEDLRQTLQDMANYNYCKDVPLSPKGKLLRFSENDEEVEFCQFEPPSYVSTD